MERKRSVLRLHHRQTFFRQKRFFDPSRMLPFNQTRVYLKTLNVTGSEEFLR